jgi:hypothetical protein
MEVVWRMGVCLVDVVDGRKNWRFGGRQVDEVLFLWQALRRWVGSETKLKQRASGGR